MSYADGKFCTELSRKHISNAFFGAELAAELEDIGQKHSTFFSCDSDKDDVMREIEKHRVGSTYTHVSGDECDKKGMLYSRKYWRELNLAVGPQIAIEKLKSIGRFKFGSLVRDHHTSTCKYEN